MMIPLSTALAAGAFAQPKQEVPDEIAYRILFKILRHAPPPHWDHQMKVNWLARYGFEGTEVLPLQGAATRYWEAIKPFEDDLKQIHSRFSGRNDSPEAVAQSKPARDNIAIELQSALRDLSTEIGEPGMQKLNRLIQLLKKEIKGPASQTQVGHSHPH
jgi:hypothetical protein